MTVELRNRARIVFLAADTDPAEQLSELLREAMGVVNKLLADKELEIISHMSPSCGRDYYYCCLCGVEAETERLVEHKKDCLYLEITALAPKIRAALEKAKWTKT